LDNSIIITVEEVDQECEIVRMISLKVEAKEVGDDEEEEEDRRS
jgi:hypothetical protein